MIQIDESTVRRLLPMRKAIELLESAFDAWAEGRAQNQPRRRVTMASGSMLHGMAGANERYFGAKIYSTNPRHGAWFHFLLYEAATARPLALFEANWLGQIRTGAASGVATKRLARPEASSIGIIGSGFQARSQLDAVRAVCPIQTVMVYSRDRDKRESFAREMKATPVESAEEAVGGADIVITATNAKEPVFEASAVRAGTHINAVGSNQANRRELPAGIFERASAIVADSVDQCRIEAGDLLLGLDEAGWRRVEELRDGRRRRSPEEITIFKSVGLGLEDLAVAGWVYEQVLLGR